MKLNKVLVIVAFPQAFIKLAVVNEVMESSNDMVYSTLTSAPQLIETVDATMEHFQNKIHEIQLVGPAIYTQKLLTDLAQHYKDNDKMTIKIVEGK